MRFASFMLEGQPSWGIVESDSVRPLKEGAAGYRTLDEAVAANALGKLTAGDAPKIPLTGVQWLPVVGTPGKIFCVGLNYEEHRRETGRAVVGHPTIFTRFADSQTGHLAPIIRPRESDKLDYEGELAIVIGKGGRRITREDALNHVAGFSCYNDGSIRDWQAHSIQFIPGKNWPDTGAFGPWLVTPDEFGDIGPQRIQTRLNGEVMQNALLSQMIFPIPDIINYCSTFTELHAGDVIVTGTPGGVGAKRDPQVFMEPGDVVEVEIDGIGILRNPIADEA